MIMRRYLLVDIKWTDVLLRIDRSLLPLMLMLVLALVLILFLI